MNRALLADLQLQRCYPSVTLLMNTTPRMVLSSSEVATARRLAQHARLRLDGDASDETKAALCDRLDELIDEQTAELSAQALALFASPDYSAAIRLGRSVDERVVIDDTFATRDLVADLNRTARYRVVTISDQRTRLLIGDRSQLVEERTDPWPMIRSGESATSWTRDVMQNLHRENTRNPLPTVVAGVDRTVRRSITPGLLDMIGFVPGNHDRTSWASLHNAVWPLVTDWLRADSDRAIEALAHARSTRRAAGGIDEIWPLANEGRVETLVVEKGYAMAARILGDHLEPAEDREAPDVIDDIIDETIEAVLRHSGNAVIVPDGELVAHGRIAAVLRY